jgi:hypothetical protein
LLAIAVPKCPLCLAAQLAFLGASVGAASTIAPLLSPLRIALAILALGLLLRSSLLVRGHRQLAARWLRRVRPRRRLERVMIRHEERQRPPEYSLGRRLRLQTRRPPRKRPGTPAVRSDCALHREGEDLLPFA